MLAWVLFISFLHRRSLGYHYGATIGHNELFRRIASDPRLSKELTRAFATGDIITSLKH